MKNFIFVALMLPGVLLLETQVAMAQDATGWESDSLAITRVLAAQQVAWNQGDIPAFMEGYWNSEELTFVGSRGITYGWQATLEGYLERYPDRATMGTLAFEILELKPLGPESAMLLGSWHLDRAENEVGGFFTLIWRKIEGKWLVVSDHTS